MSKKYRIYCTEPGDEGFQFVWGETAPTECPNNALHSVNPNSINIIAREIPAIVVIPKTERIKNKDFTRIASVNYNADISGNLRRIKILSSGEENVTSYDIVIFNRTTKEKIAYQSFSNTGEETLQDVGEITTSLSGDNIIEVYMKMNSLKGKGFAKISQIIFYVEGNIRG